MKIGLIGLGRMGNSIAYRLINAGHEVIGFDPNVKAQEEATKYGATIAQDYEQLLKQARITWFMVPAGKAVDATIEKLTPHLQAGDIVVDGGNSLFSSTILRGKKLAEANVHYLDCGTSGGILGKETGFSLMIGGEQEIFERVKPIFEAIAAPNGFGYMGPSGAGHYVKMIHNGIEYSVLQAYAEGIHLLKKGHYKNLDLASITKVWSHGSVIKSLILDLAHEVLVKDQEFEDISGEIAENFTGRWTLEEALKQGIAMDLLERSLHKRTWSRQTGGNYATKLIAMLRNKFGGHEVKKATKDD